jgi:hypothetical protein
VAAISKTLFSGNNAHEEEAIDEDDTNDSRHLTSASELVEGEDGSVNEREVYDHLLSLENDTRYSEERDNDDDMGVNVDINMNTEVLGDDEIFPCDELEVDQLSSDFQSSVAIESPKDLQDYGVN